MEEGGWLLLVEPTELLLWLYRKQWNSLGLESLFDFEAFRDLRVHQVHNKIPDFLRRTTASSILVAMPDDSISDQRIPSRFILFERAGEVPKGEQENSCLPDIDLKHCYSDFTEGTV